jgi:hypothetical protein
MESSDNPKPADIRALKEIIAGTPADPMTMKQLMTCNLVEELDGTAILTDKGLQAAVRLIETMDEKDLSKMNG